MLTQQRFTTIKQIRDAVQRELTRQSKATSSQQTPPAWPGVMTEVISTTHQARFGQNVRVRHTSADVLVGLPRIGQGDIGKTVAVTRVLGSSGKVTIFPRGSDTVDGYPVIDIVSDTYLVVFVASELGLWTAIPRGESTVGYWSDDFTASALNAQRWYASPGNGTIAQAGGVAQLGVPAAAAGDWWTTVSNAPRMFFKRTDGLRPSQGVQYVQSKVTGMSAAGPSHQAGVAVTNLANYINFGASSLSVRGYWVAYGAGAVTWQDIGGVAIASQGGVAAPSVAVPHLYRIYVNASGIPRSVSVGTVSVLMESGSLWATWSVDGGVTWFPTPAPALTLTGQAYPLHYTGTTTPWTDMTCGFSQFLKVWTAYGAASTVDFDAFEAGVL